LRDCLQAAYGLQDYQISGPDWLRSERYDIAAKAAGATTGDQAKLMLQTLLAQRFQLTLHRETKDLPVYALVPAKGGHKLRAAASNASGGAHFQFMKSGLHLA